jgi:hypothetical protein
MRVYWKPFVMVLNNIPLLLYIASKNMNNFLRLFKEKEIKSLNLWVTNSLVCLEFPKTKIYIFTQRRKKLACSIWIVAKKSIVKEWLSSERKIFCFPFASLQGFCMRKFVSILHTLISFHILWSCSFIFSIFYLSILFARNRKSKVFIWNDGEENK